MTTKHAALFDLDGVIIDTEGTYTKFWAKMGREYGVPYSDFAHRIKGTTLAQILNKYFPQEKHEEIIHKLVEFEDTMEYNIFPGVMPFLKELKSAGIPAAIVTSSGDKKMNRLWDSHPHLKDYFQAIITDANVTRSKPDPQGYQLAASALNASPKNCYVFEDSYNGLEAGRRSGAKVIALATTNPANTLHDLADLTIGSFDSFSISDLPK